MYWNCGIKAEEGLGVIEVSMRTAQYQTAFKVANLMNSKKPVEVRAHDMLYPEQIFQAFEGDGVSWLNFDPRVEWLMEYLKQNRHEKVLVICAAALPVNAVPH